MSTALFTHPACVLHEMGTGHPESPERLKAVLAELKKPEYAALQHYEAPLATVDQIARVHNRSYAEKLLEHLPARGYVALDPDTSLSPSTGEAALRATGAVIAAVDAIMAGKIGKAFCAVRPPGHHAEIGNAMGFCFFNNIAVGAAHAMEEHKVKRIAVVDFDVHHGNGTQDWAMEQENVLFVSSHQSPCYPGTGAAQEKGPHGNIINLPLPPGAGSLAFRNAMSQSALPALARFHPELIMISAGFDAHRDDPLASLSFTEDDYGWITTELSRLAAQHASGHMISTLEGGYNVKALAASTGAHVRAML